MISLALRPDCGFTALSPSRPLNLISLEANGIEGACTSRGYCRLIQVTRVSIICPDRALSMTQPCISPITEAYYGARAFARSPNFSSFCVTKEEYAEGGSNACRKKFLANQFGGIASSKEKAGEDEGLTEGESRSSTAKVDLAAAKAQADKEARAARRQTRGARK